MKAAFIDLGAVAMKMEGRAGQCTESIVRNGLPAACRRDHHVLFSFQKRTPDCRPSVLFAV